MYTRESEWPRLVRGLASCCERFFHSSALFFTASSGTKGTAFSRSSRFPPSLETEELQAPSPILQRVNNRLSKQHRGSTWMARRCSRFPGSRKSFGFISGPSRGLFPLLPSARRPWMYVSSLLPTPQNISPPPAHRPPIPPYRFAGGQRGVLPHDVRTPLLRVVRVPALRAEPGVRGLRRLASGGGHLRAQPGPRLQPLREDRVPGMLLLLLLSLLMLLFSSLVRW